MHDDFEVAKFNPKKNSEGFVYDKEEADNAVEFFTTFLKHVKGKKAGEPFDLEDANGWMANVVRALWGWRDPVTGNRRFRQCYITCGRKNSKSTLGAGIALLSLIYDKEPSAEIFSCAASRDQARLLFDIAVGMIRQSPILSNLLETSIILKSSGSVYKVISADANVQHGANCSCCLFDELHCQKTRELWDVMLTSMAARKQPLMIAMTTAGSSRDSICFEVHQYAERVRDGEIDDPHFLPIIYDSGGHPWDSDEALQSANPSLGYSLDLEYLQKERKRAKEQASFSSSFRRLHVNEWVESDIAFFRADDLEKCLVPFDEEMLKGRDCIAGLDLSSTTDITALVLLFPNEKQDECHCLAKLWLPTENIFRAEKRDGLPYAAWAEQGHIERTEGNIVDYDRIKDVLLSCSEKYRILGIGADPWNAHHFLNQLVDQNNFPILKVRQGFFTLSNPCKRLESLVMQHKFYYNSPAVRSHFASTRMVNDENDNLRPSKAKSNSRIDALAATLNALAVLEGIKEQQDSVYNERGLLHL
jgi:phage terminase large subunit-like protein